jgi:hypothetical protein
MRVKQLLMSSCAVLTATTASYAADAVIAEPEPIEYVRICDAYGAGYFYIPGTETCIRFNGQVRGDYAVKHFDEEQDDETSVHETRYRVRLEITARNETEYGTLESRFRLKAEEKSDKGTGEVDPETGEGGGHNDQLSSAEGPDSAAVVVDKALISLAGFTVGFDDNYFKRAGHDGWYVGNARFEGPYGDYDALFFEYTYKFDGFALTAGLEDGNISGEAGAPDPYAGITYTAGGLYLAGIAYYDGSTSAGAYKGRFDYDFGESWSYFKVGGWYTWDNGETDYVKGHALGITSQVNLGDSVILFGGYGMYDNQYADSEKACSGEDCEVTLNNSGIQWKVGLQWEIVPNLFFLPEYQVTDYEQEYSDQQDYGILNLRLVRNF